MKINLLYNKHASLIINLPRTPNTRFSHQPAKDTKSRQNYQDKFLKTKFNHQPIRDLNYHSLNTPSSQRGD